MRGLDAVQAYRKSAGHRNFREQEADLFRAVNRRLRGGQTTHAGGQAQALADNERLWITLMDLLSDPDNQLPTPIRASILSIGHAVRREHAAHVPDLAFLIGINEQVAAGLAGQ